MAAEGVALPDEPGPARRRRPVPGPPHRDPGAGRDAALRREPPPAGGPLPAPGRHGRRRPLRDRRPAAPGQGALLQQRPRRLGRGRDRPPPARPRLRHRQAHQPLRRRGARRRSPPPGTTPSPPTRSPPSAASWPSPGRSTARSPSAWRASSSRSSWRPAFDAGGPRGPGGEAEPAPRRGPGARRATPPLPRAEPDRLAPHAPAGPSSSPRRTPRPTTRRPGRWPRSARPTDAERRDLDLAWRLVRGVTSNAIVLVRDGMLIGIGSGQTSRVDAARQAVAKATALLGRGPSRRRGLRLGRLLPVPGRGRGLPRRPA